MWKILAALIAAYPQPLTKDQISALTAFKRTSRDTYLSRLKSTHLCTAMGKEGYVAAKELFHG
jgi:hypothetical protein